MLNVRNHCHTLPVVLQDPQLQKRLQQVLKLNKEKWEEARDHALKAVVVDNRMRVWWAASTPPSSNRVGTFFTPATHTALHSYHAFRARGDSYSLTTMQYGRCFEHLSAAMICGPEVPLRSSPVTVLVLYIAAVGHDCWVLEVYLLGV